MPYNRQPLRPFAAAPCIKYITDIVIDTGLDIWRCPSSFTSILSFVDNVHLLGIHVTAGALDYEQEGN